MFPLNPFIEFLKFLSDEEGLAYDSQIEPTIETINDEIQNVIMLRVGRFYFAVQTDEATYLYKKDPIKGYYLDLENPLPLFERKNIENAILMIQGKKPPDMIKLPISPLFIRKGHQVKKEENAMKRIFVIKLLLFMGFFLFVGPGGLYSAEGGLFDRWFNKNGDDKDKKEKEQEKTEKKKEKDSKQKLTPHAAAQYQKEIKKLTEEYNQLRAEYWLNKQKRIEDKKQALDRLENIKQSSSILYEDKNSVVQELYLIKEELKTMQEKRKTIKEDQESFRAQVKEVIQKETYKVSALYPYLLEEGIILMGRIGKRLEHQNYKGAIRALFEYKVFIISEGETAEVGIKKMNPKKDKKIPLEESTYLRLGYMHQTYTSSNMSGLLVRGISLKGIVYSWHDDLPNSLKKDISDGVNEAFILAGKGDKRVNIPIDVTQAGNKLRIIIEGGSGNVFNEFLVFFASGGVIMYPLFLMALVAFVIMTERIIFYVRTNRRGKIVLGGITQLVENKQLEQAIDLCHQNTSSVSEIIFPILDKNLNREQAENVLDESFSKTTPKLQKRLPTLAVLAGVAPLLGLLGTVSGMIALFDVITIYGTSNPKILAGGISIALVTTQTGLAIAIPIMLVHHTLSRVKTSITNRAEQSALHILNFLHPAPKKQKA